jgi:uncharacterized low-complexity protein
MKKHTRITLSSALIIGLSSTAAHAEQLFTLQELSVGYQLGSQTDALSQSGDTTALSVKDKEGKCGENKCGENKCGTKK